MYRELYADDIEAHAATPEIAELLALYRSMMQADGRVPYAAFMRRVSGELGGDLTVVRPYGERDYLYSQFGANVAAVTGTDMTGRLVSEFEDEVGRFLKDIYDWVLAHQRPLFAIHRASHQTHVHLWERLALPCRDWNGSSRIVIYVRPRELRAEMLNAMLEASQDGILAFQALRDPAGDIADAVVFSANRQAAAFLGRRVEEMIDSRALVLFPELRETGVWDRYLRVMTERVTDRFELDHAVAGSPRTFRITAVPLGDGLMVSMNDISDLQRALREAERAKEHLRAQSVTDALTGVLNRRGFGDAVRAQTASARRYGHALSVIAVDLDHFKRINDLHGHAAGDTVLMSAAALLKEECRENLDVVGRVGGEEFMILLPHTPLAGAIAWAERARTRLAELTFSFGEPVATITASFGVREFDRGGDAESMLIQADDALYSAKRAGRNRVAAWAAAVAAA